MSVLQKVYKQNTEYHVHHRFPPSQCSAQQQQHQRRKK